MFEQGSGDSAGQCRFRLVGDENKGYGPCSARITWPNDGGQTRAIIAGRSYAHGSLQLRPASAERFNAVLAVGLEQYMYGLAEVPSSWPNAALDAQAIIGRGYAIATALARGGSNGSGRLGACGCHIRSDTRDQAYNGWAKEAEPTYGARWKAAVDRTGTGTGHQVVTHPQAPNRIISAFYSSSNGGASENVEEVWGGDALPWLRSVDDPWSANPDINPLARWSVFLSGDVLQSRLCSAGHCWDAVTGGEMESGPPAARIRLYGLVGREIVSTVVSGTWLYNALYAVLIVFFTYFYTAIIFNPVDLAENLKKQGAFVPGVKPGAKTAEYIDHVLSRITVAGSVYLALIALLPFWIFDVFNITTFMFGGTSLLIVVGVALDTVQQMQQHMLLRHYEGFMKKGRVRFRGRQRYM